MGWLSAALLMLAGAASKRWWQALLAGAILQFVLSILLTLASGLAAGGFGAVRWSVVGAGLIVGAFWASLGFGARRVALAYWGPSQRGR